jgi:hypothetical protein
MALPVSIHRSNGVMEYWSVGVKNKVKDVLNFRLFFKDPAFQEAVKEGDFSITPSLQYSNTP